MRETRQSGSEGGVGLIPHPYPYRRRSPLKLHRSAIYHFKLGDISYLRKLIASLDWSFCGLTNLPLSFQETLDRPDKNDYN